MYSPAVCSRSATRFVPMPRSTATVRLDSRGFAGRGAIRTNGNAIFVKNGSCFICRARARQDFVENLLRAWPLFLTAALLWRPTTTRDGHTQPYAALFAEQSIFITNLAVFVIPCQNITLWSYNFSLSFRERNLGSCVAFARWFAMETMFPLPLKRCTPHDRA